MDDVHSYAEEYHRQVNGYTSSNETSELPINTDWSEHLTNAGRHHSPIPGGVSSEIINVPFSASLRDLIASSFTNGKHTTWSLNDNMVRSNLIDSGAKGTREVVSNITVKAVRNSCPYAVGIKMNGVKIGTRNICKPLLNDCTTFIGTKFGESLKQNVNANTTTTGPDFVIVESQFENSPVKTVLYDGRNTLTDVVSQIQKSNVGRLTEEAIDNSIIEKDSKKAKWVVKENSPIIDVMQRFPELVGLTDYEALKKNAARVIVEKTGEARFIVGEKIADNAVNLLKVNYRQIPFWDPNKVKFEMHFISNPEINPDNFTDEQLDAIHHVNALVEVQTKTVPISQ